MSHNLIEELTEILEEAHKNYGMAKITANKERAIVKVIQEGSNMTNHENDYKQAIESIICRIDIDSIIPEDMLDELINKLAKYVEEVK